MPALPLVAERLFFRYGKGGADVLHDFSVEVPQGSIAVVTGSSGSGKSTLLSLLGLLLQPQNGRLQIAGHSTEALSDFSRSSLRAHYIGFLFQDALLDPTRSVLDNVIQGALYNGVPKLDVRRRALQLLERVGIDSQLVHRRLPRAISGGQAQRVALCRALIKSPQVVVADEPTGNLDEESANAVLELLAESAGSGSIVVVATHDLRLVKHADLRVELT